MSARQSISLFLILVLADGAGAHTWSVANNCQACSTACCVSSSDGDTVAIGAGVATYGSPINWTNKKLYVHGANTDTSNLSTIIKYGVSGSNSIFQFVCSVGHVSRISGIKFNGPSNSSQSFISVQGTGYGFRIDHCVFDTMHARGITIFGNTNARLYGLIDNCIFRESQPNYSQQGISIFMNYDSSWSQPARWGSDSAIYVEDCFFDYASAGDNTVESYRGARYVQRHCKIRNSLVGGHGFDSDPRSTFSFEIYNNTFTADNETGIAVLRSRGGTGIIYNNTITGATEYDTNGIYVMYYRSCECPGCPGSQTNCSGWDVVACGDGRCDGTRAVDGNDSADGYPCRDQPGRGTDLPGSVEEPNPMGHQTYEPMYCWNNYVNGHIANMQVNPGVWATKCAGMMHEHIKPGRDYFNGIAKPGYAAFTYPHPLQEIKLLSAYKTANKESSRITIRLGNTSFSFTLPSSIQSPELTVIDLSGREVYRAMLNKTGKSVYKCAWREAPAAGIYFAVIIESSGKGKLVLARTKFVVGK